VGAMTASFVASLLTAFAGLLAAACFTPRRHLGRGDSWISFAIGALAGTALVELLPRAWQDLGSAPSALSLTLLGAACCFALDRIFHCRPTAHEHGEGHGEHCYLTEAGAKASSGNAPGRILLLGDFFHSVVDGSLIAGAFMTGLPLGVLVVGAIVVHEIPRKCATIFMLIHAGRTRGQALLLGAVSSLGVLGGAVAAWVSLSLMSSANPLLLVGGATLMLYVAVVELMPILRTDGRAFMTFKHACFMLLGLVCVGGTHLLLEPVV
jgi:zinc transporter ZupT